jgi:hypothetical protein
MLIVNIFENNPKSNHEQQPPDYFVALVSSSYILSGPLAYKLFGTFYLELYMSCSKVSNASFTFNFV